MSPETIKIIITAILVLHGIAHGRAAITLLVVATSKRKSSWIPMRSWLFPKLPQKTAAVIAFIFWLPATLGFIAAALLYWSDANQGDLWRQLAVGAAIISTLGSALFSGIWPGAPEKRLSTLDTVISLVVNLAIFVTLLWMQWPPVA